MVDQIYPAELQLNKVSSSDTVAPLIFNLSISNGTVSTKIYGKRDDFYFDIVNFPSFEIYTLHTRYAERHHVPRHTLYEVYIP